MKKLVSVLVAWLVISSFAFADDVGTGSSGGSNTGLFGSLNKILTHEKEPEKIKVQGLIAAGVHSDCSKDDCWKTVDDVLKHKGKPSRATDFTTRFAGTLEKHTVYYFDSANQTEVYVVQFYDYGGSLLLDDYVTSVPNFVAAKDRAE